MSATPTPPHHEPHPQTTSVVRVTEKLREQAALRLVQSGGSVVGTRSPRSARDARALLRSASEQGFNFDHLWASVREPGSSIRGVAWAVEGAGRTWMLFTSTPADDADADALGRVIDAACNSVETGGLAQALIEPGEDLARRAFLAGGFRKLAVLQYLRKRIERAGDGASTSVDWGAMGVELVPYVQSTDAQLGEALTASYEGTLDCPGLSELREIEDVIASHKATGRFDPEWWWIIRDNATRSAAGALLLTPCPDQGSVELVYIGIAPRLRGRGIARALLGLGERTVRERGEKALACAVDERNAPALKLYDVLGFTGFARRTALVRALRD